MDIMSLTIAGYVGKVTGKTVDNHRRDCFRFSLAANLRRADTTTTVWAQITVLERGLLELICERGIVTGERVLCMSNFINLAATARDGEPKAWLNVLCTELIFLSEPAREKITPLLPARTESPILQFEQLINRKIS